MKKGLLSLLVVALTVVGCQDYDDQFDSLNKEILALKTDLTTIKGLTTSVAAISTEIKALEGKMVTDADITGILTQVAAVKAAVAALPAPADVSGITTEVADLNSEIATILEQLTKIQAASGGTYTGNLNITNAVQLTAAEDIVDASADGPKMTITGNVNIDADNTGTKEAANILRIQAILNKLKVVSGNVTITGVDTPLEAAELLYVTGTLDVEGTSTMGLAKLNTVDGLVTLDLYGDLSYGLLGSAGGGVVLSSTGTITVVNFEGLSTGGVTTAAGVLVLPLATEVTVGSLPASVTLASALTVSAKGIASLGNMSMSAPKATNVNIHAAKITGVVTVSANLAAIAMDATETSGLTQLHGATVDISKMTKNTAHLTVSATTLSAAALKTANATITLVSISTVALPALTSVTSLTGSAISSFSAPLLTTAAGKAANLDLKAGASVTMKSIGTTYTLVDLATIGELTLSAQANDLILDEMVKLTTLNYTSSVIGGTLTVSASMVSMTTLTLGSGSRLTTLTVSATNMVTLGTAGVILNTNIVNNTKLETLSFGHTHLNGELATTVDIINNDKLLALDMSSLGKVKEVEVTGNASLTTFTAPSFANKAEPQVTISVTFTGNDITGTYSATVEATETTPVVPYTASSAAITSWKGFIDGYKTTNTVLYNLDIDRISLGSDTDGLYDNGAYSDAVTSTTNAIKSGTISTTAQLSRF